MNSEKPAVVIGRQLFVDLWSISGFRPLVCESPDELSSFIRSIEEMDAAIVVVEKGWFERIPKSLYSKLTKSRKPVWVPFPSIGPVDLSSER